MSISERCLIQQILRSRMTDLLLYLWVLFFSTVMFAVIAVLFCLALVAGIVLPVWIFAWVVKTIRRLYA